MLAIFDGLDLNDPDAVIATFNAGAQACRAAHCRNGSVEIVRSTVESPLRLIATGDIHDNPLYLARVITAAQLGASASDAPEAKRAHLTLHELIHPDRLLNGLDFSYRTLARAACLKAAHPEFAHVLLANHELAQVVGAGIIKDGVRVVDAFNEAIELTFEDDAPRVNAALEAFIRALPIGLILETQRENKPIHRVLCAHSLPAPNMIKRFDHTLLCRDLTEDDYIPRQGSAHFLVWGRGHTAEQLDELATALDIDLFILGHEKAVNGSAPLGNNAIILNTDHQSGVYLDLDLAHAHCQSSAIRTAQHIDPQHSM